MNPVKAWKEPEYRDSLSEAEQASLPPNPAGLVSLTHRQLGEVAGATSAVCATISISIGVSAWLCMGTKSWQSIGCC
ncbi:mersacidin/lichenicidin family type 2 lantibiotic [Streptomyces sp. NPDC005209]|uniref:mersacidin/lichenicidin family type 2 lantibiotic n=1 Tax=Streptomyces sp. NPDC005209 TaxID=3156715 RepID=UPI0033BDCD15